jgi:hypothetical protein
MESLNDIMTLSQQIEIVLAIKTLAFFVGTWLAFRAYRVIHRPTWRAILFSAGSGLAVLGVFRAFELWKFPGEDIANDAIIFPIVMTTAFALTLVVALAWVVVRQLEEASEHLLAERPETSVHAMQATDLLNDIDEQLITRVLNGDIPPIEERQIYHDRQIKLTKARAASARL